MKYLELQIVPWDDPCYTVFNGNRYKVGDKVLLECDWGKEVATVMARPEIKDTEPERLVSITGLVDQETEDKLRELIVAEQAALDFCHQRAKELGLPMKLVNAHFSLDKKRLLFAFIAQGRVDFRSLLKDLTKQYLANIRLQQIGVRDEARISGDIGPCGYRLCCQTHLQALGNISTEMAQKQQITHRGVDRLSGACGRLKCCLAFENGQYDKKK